MSKQDDIRDIVNLIIKAQSIGTRNGYRNLLQPGLVKELIIGKMLGHEVHTTKHDADATDPNDASIMYEYLSCFEGGTFQLDRMFKCPPDKRAQSLERITRNKFVYCAVFNKYSPLEVLEIYEVNPNIMLAEAERQLDASSNDISHIGFTIKWARENGRKL
ncbi:MAG: hypothetical protein LBM95_04585 [Lactobacillales bacterium]|jgi:hypothetical protein|nr:hypothetical protein [Lactobacillales bacterium]